MNSFLEFIKSNTGIILINIAAIISMLVLAIYFGLSSPIGSKIPHKTDAEMTANFQNHKSNFEKMLQMIEKDKDLKRVDNTWTLPEDPQTIGVSPERIAEYKELFRKAQTPRGFYSYLPNSVMFIGSSQGLAVSGSSKSYMIFFESAPENIVDDTDKYRSKGSVEAERRECKFPVYKQIENNWYIRYDAD